MASETLLLYAIGLPLVGASAAWIAGFRAWKTLRVEVRSQPRSGPNNASPRGRFFVLMVLPATLVLFGYATFFLLSRQDGIGEAVANAAALAYGSSGLLTGVGFAIVLHSTVAPAVRDQTAFGRATFFAVLPETAALFGFAIAFLTLQAARDFAGDAQTLLLVSERAASYASAGSMGAPLAAYLSVRAYNFVGARSFSRAVSFGSLGTLVMVVFFLLAFNALSAVS